MSGSGSPTRTCCWHRWVPRTRCGARICLYILGCFRSSLLYPQVHVNDTPLKRAGETAPIDGIADGRKPNPAASFVLFLWVLLLSLCYVEAMVAVVVVCLPPCCTPFHGALVGSGP